MYMLIIRQQLTENTKTFFPILDFP